MSALAATNRESTIVRTIKSSDLRRLMRMVDTAWRVHLRISPVELDSRIKENPGFLAEDRVGLRGFMLIEPLQLDAALIIAAGLRDTWNVDPFLDLILPKVQQAVLNNDLSALVFIGSTNWLVDDLLARGFETREWIVAFERLGTEPPAKPKAAPAQIRTAHISDLSALMALDSVAFSSIWHKTSGNINQALASAVSFSVAVLDDQIVAYEWCEIYKEHAHLTRLAVHPDYQGRGIGRQLLYQAIIDALAAGADIITLNTQESNKRSRALYKRFGFVDTKQRMPVMWKDLK